MKKKTKIFIVSFNNLISINAPLFDYLVIAVNKLDTFFLLHTLIIFNRNHKREKKIEIFLHESGNQVKYLIRKKKV